MMLLALECISLDTIGSWLLIARAKFYFLFISTPPFRLSLPISTILRFQIDHLFEEWVYNFYLNENFNFIGTFMSWMTTTANEKYWVFISSNLVHNFLIYYLNILYILMRQLTLKSGKEMRWIISRRYARWLNWYFTTR